MTVPSGANSCSFGCSGPTDGFFGKNTQDNVNVGVFAKKSDFNQTVNEIDIVMDIDSETVLFMPLIKSTVTPNDLELSVDINIAYSNKVGKQNL